MVKLHLLQTIWNATSYTKETLLPVLQVAPVQVDGQLQWLGLEHVPPFAQDGLHIANFLKK